MAKVILISGKEKKIINFYPNVFKDEVKTIVGDIKNGDVVDVCSSDGAFVGKDLTEVDFLFDNTAIALTELYFQWKEERKFNYEQKIIYGKR